MFVLQIVIVIWIALKHDFCFHFQANVVFLGNLIRILLRQNLSRIAHTNSFRYAVPLYVDIITVKFVKFISQYEKEMQQKK